jgi:hypothetical protein
MKLKKFVQGAEGSIMVITALGLVVFLGFASLAIDMGRLYVAKNELQNTADAAALAGTSHLITQQNGQAVRDDAAAKQAVMDVAQRQSELLGQTPLEPEARNDVTVVFGEWNIYAGNPDTAWTPYGSTCGAYQCQRGASDAPAGFRSGLRSGHQLVVRDSGRPVPDHGGGGHSHRVPGVCHRCANRLGQPALGHTGHGDDGCQPG